MNDEELKRLWLEQKSDPAKLSPNDQVKLMQRESKNLERASLCGDAVSVTIGGMGILFFAWALLKTPLPLARIGLVIIIASLAFDIWKTIRARRASPRLPADAPVTEWLRHELKKVGEESELKRGKLWSNLLPFWIGAIVFTWGLEIDLSSRIFFSAVLTGLSAFIYVWALILHEYTRRKAYLPLKEQLESLLKSNAPEQFN